MMRHGAEMLWKVGTYEEIEGERKEIWNEGNTRRRIETDNFTYKHADTYKHASHTSVILHTGLVLRVGAGSKLVAFKSCVVRSAGI